MSRHVLVIDDERSEWHLEHPDECATDQLGCAYTSAASNHLAVLAQAFPDEVEPGRFVITLGDDGVPTITPEE